jgi:hypothetical protein
MTILTEKDSVRKATSADHGGGKAARMQFSGPRALKCKELLPLSHIARMGKRQSRWLVLQGLAALLFQLYGLRNNSGSLAIFAATAAPHCG